MTDEELQKAVTTFSIILVSLGAIFPRLIGFIQKPLAILIGVILFFFIVGNGLSLYKMKYIRAQTDQLIKDSHQAYTKSVNLLKTKASKDSLVGIIREFVSPDAYFVGDENEATLCAPGDVAIYKFSSSDNIKTIHDVCDKISGSEKQDKYKVFFPVKLLSKGAYTDDENLKPFLQKYGLINNNNSEGVKIECYFEKPDLNPEFNIPSLIRNSYENICAAYKLYEKEGVKQRINVKHIGYIQVGEGENLVSTNVEWC